MEKEILIQTTGNVAKEESVFTLSDHIIPNTFVIENEVSYPGYHGKNLPDRTKPMSVFLMAKEKFSMEKILRLRQQIKKYFPEPFDAVPGKICYNTETLNCIRLRDLDSYEYLEKLQKSFGSEGIRFLKKRNIKGPVTINLKKVFFIKEISEEIYQDLDEESTFYLNIGEQMSFEKFRQLTLRVKNNIDKEKRNFDAAWASIYTKEIMDAVRVYSTNISLEKLMHIRKQYLEELKKME